MARNSTIDLLKFIFAVTIVIFHGGTNLWHGAKGEYPMSGGAIGVEFFFIVSGYLMVASESRRAEKRVSLVDDTCSFIRGKIRSLLPAYFIAWLSAFVFTNLSEGDVSLPRLIKRLSYSVFELGMVPMSGLNFYRVNHATWYISAMLLGMVILYPLLAKKRNLFLNIIAPFAAIMLSGYLYQTYGGGLEKPAAFDGFMLKGLERAIACMCIGAVCWNVVHKFKERKYTKFAAVLLTLLEAGCYGYVLLFAWFMSHSAGDYVCIILLAIALTITFSGKSFMAIRDSRICGWLGEWSLYLFLNNGYWAHVMRNLYPESAYSETMPRYLLCVVVSSLSILFLSNFLKKRSERIFGCIKRALLAE